MAPFPVMWGDLDKMLTPFQEALVKVLLSIPSGRVASFGDIARALGDVKAALAVKRECYRLRSLRPDVPWWRAVNSSGIPLEGAAPLLREEGSLINSRVRPESFTRELTQQPLLSKFRLVQLRLAEKLVIEGEPKPRTAGGVDISYIDLGNVEMAFASCVLMDMDLNVLEISRFRYRPPIPYIPTYLAFREIRGMLVTSRRCNPDILFIDGQGILHPRVLGEASHVGLIADLPSIGVAKSKLIGEVKGAQVLIGGKQRGWFFRRGFVSPGHMVGIKESLKLAKLFWNPKERQPRPLILAHKDSKSESRGLSL